MYIPIDINQHLLASAIEDISTRTSAEIPFGILTDFEERVSFIEDAIKDVARHPILFGLIGNTLGNLDNYERMFLAEVRELAKPNDLLLIEVALDDGGPLLNNPNNRALRDFYATGAAHQVKRGAADLSKIEMELDEKPKKKSDVGEKTRSFEIFYSIPDPDEEGETKKITALRSCKYDWDEMLKWLGTFDFDISRFTPKTGELRQLGVVLLKKRTAGSK
jgi:hypothetical protein